jgi:hypothetical protein
MQQETGSSERDAFGTEHVGDTKEVVAPGAHRPLRELVQWEIEALGKFFGLEHETRVAAESHGDARCEIDSAWHHEAVVVVGVLSDQIHTTGGGDDSGRGSESGGEALGEGGGRQSGIARS